MWGTLYPQVWKAKYDRFIPTYVGNMGRYGDVSARYAVHPHVCGEHQVLLFRLVMFIGSSPRMWGTFLIVVLRLFY